MPANYAGYSPDYGRTPPDYDEGGINGVDEALSRIARSVKNRFVYGPGIEPPPDVGMYNPMPRPTPAPGPVEEETNIVTQPQPQMPTRPSMPSPINTGAASPAGMQEPAPSSIRAIKMPNGRIQFTNIDTTPTGEAKQGEWTDYGDAATQFRDQQQASPTSAAMSALVQASIRSAGNGPGGMSATQGMTGDPRNIQPQLEQAAGLSHLAEVQAQGAEAERRTRESTMTPEQRATAINPQIGIAKDARAAYLEESQKNLLYAERLKVAVQTPGNPKYRPNPDEQKLAIAGIDAERDKKDMDILDRFYASMHASNLPAPVDQRR